jgi:DNA-binding NtrC family response regulator
MKAEILVVDDQEAIRHFISRFLIEEDTYEVSTAATGAEALKVFDDTSPDLVILDLKLPDMSGLQVLEEMRRRDSEATVIIITAFGQIETAVTAMRLGAEDFITKPVILDQLLLAIERVLQKKQMAIEVNFHRKRLREQYQFDKIIGNCDRMKAVHRIVDQVAKSSATSVLIEGESGTGKELIAHIVHHKSVRADQPFMDINCASLPETLLEAELFGYEKGAFTDAKAQKKGLIELADGGTLFLDEIGEMSPASQVKLLRVLERMVFKRVGGTKDISVDVRIISATNRDLRQMVADGLFREDLYYRLKVVPVLLPPLRERGKDIIMLAKYFLGVFNKAFNKNFQRITPGAEQLILEYRWPGNIRELKNLLERTVLLEDGEEVRRSMLHDLRIDGPGRASGIVGTLDEILRNDIRPEGILFNEIIREIEKSLILKALTETNWNQSETAALLNIKRDKLRYRMKLYDLKRDDDHGDDTERE